MDYLLYKNAFDRLMGVKHEPNQYELFLLKRAKKYIEKITWVPGIRMVAIVNSLSMYATHRDSDIDLFIVTEKNRMWLARVCVTLTFWVLGVWRKGADVAGNFCLSFWIEDDAMNLRKIALRDDIYLYFWMYYMKPILLDTTIWSEFLEKNQSFLFSKDAGNYFKFKKGKLKPSFFGRIFLDLLNSILRYFGEKKSMKRKKELGDPGGVIITKNMLKFHDQDRRKEIRDRILGREESSE